MLRWMFAESLMKMQANGNKLPESLSAQIAARAGENPKAK
jgi:hypothetical protein